LIAFRLISKPNPIMIMISFRSLNFKKDSSRQPSTKKRRGGSRVQNKVIKEDIESTEEFSTSTSTTDDDESYIIPIQQAVSMNRFQTRSRLSAKNTMDSEKREFLLDSMEKFQDMLDACCDDDESESSNEAEEENEFF
jgi:hypothetical protein